MKTIEKDPDLLLSYDPNYLLLEINDKEYIFYNSIRHFGCRISKIELLLLNILYKYDSIDYIIKNIQIGQKDKTKEILQKLSDSYLLSTTPFMNDECSMKNSVKLKTFYFHLTYRCNLNCSYCYNQKIRKDKNIELTIQEWKAIVNKISPCASMIILTGGECFLYKDILPLLVYIKEKIPKVRLSCISNCMHDFSNGNINRTLNYFDDITFSCDSISEEGERIGFNPKVFQRNIEYIRNNFPKLEINISKTDTICSAKDIVELRNFSKKTGCNITNIILNPEKYDDIEKMPPIAENNDNNSNSLESTSENLYSNFRGKKSRCGAAKNTCSIDPVGNVYPCQSLHFEEFLMGNILRQNIEELRYQDEEECIPCIDEISECSKCKVKYICGGGCLASSYELNKRKLGRNK